VFVWKKVDQIITSGGTVAYKSTKKALVGEQTGFKGEFVSRVALFLIEPQTLCVAW
jgi:hypothetical protein